MLKYAPQILLLSIFAGCFIAMRRAFQQREMDAWFSAGLGLHRFIRPLLVFALPGAVFVGIFSLFLSPWAVSEIRLAKTTAAVNFNFDTLPQGRFVDIPGSNYTYFWSGDGDIFFARNNTANQETIFTRSLHTPDHQHLQLRNGTLYRFIQNANNETVSETLKFDTINLALPAIVDNRSPLRERETTRLAWKNTNERAELIWRINLAIAAVVLVLTALLLAKYNPNFGKRTDYLSAIFVFFLYLNMLRYVKTLTHQDLSAPLAILLPPLLILAVVALVTTLVKQR